jgi:general secretion pathway protein G
MHHVSIIESEGSHMTTNIIHRRQRGFTLIEIMIVIIILGILAAIVMPAFSDATHEARENTLKDCLRYMRNEITIFTAQHRDVPPGYPGGSLTAAPDAATFVSQMTSYSDEMCNLNATPSDVFHFGQYLSSMPVNPLNSQNGVWVVTGVTPAPDASQPFGWIYNATTQEIRANVTGSDGAGKAYSTY